MRGFWGVLFQNSVFPKYFSGISFDFVLLRYKIHPLEYEISVIVRHCINGNKIILGVFQGFQESKIRFLKHFPGIEEIWRVVFKKFSFLEQSLPHQGKHDVV